MNEQTRKQASTGHSPSQFPALGNGLTSLRIANQKTVFVSGILKPFHSDYLKPLFKEPAGTYSNPMA